MWYNVIKITIKGVELSMKHSKFWIFLLIITAALWALPEQILDKNLASINAPPPETVSEPIFEAPRYKGAEPQELIYTALKDLKSEVYMPANLTSDDIFDIRNEVLEDNPEFFYLDYSNSRYWSNGKLEFNYIDTKENIEKKREAIESKADAIINKIIKPGMSEAKKELAIHDYIVANTKYDVENYENNTTSRASHNIDGVLLDGTAVCEGYAKTFKLLLERVGIESMIVVGPKINHAWNIVKIDGEYYHVDVTWNDPVPDVEGRVLHTYFNVPDKRMVKGKHVWDQSMYPTCTSDKYSFMWGQ